MSNPAVETFWQAFLKDTGRPADTKYYSSFYFDLTEKWANALLELVLSGKKRATASALPALQADGQPLPQVGDLSIVTDFAGTPRCVIETTAVTILPFREMTYEICSREGEDDTLESWQEGHIRFFSEEGKNLGFEFSWDMPVVFEDFEVVYAP